MEILLQYPLYISCYCLCAYKKNNSIDLIKLERKTYFYLFCIFPIIEKSQIRDHLVRWPHDRATSTLYARGTYCCLLPTFAAKRGSLSMRCSRSLKKGYIIESLCFDFCFMILRLVKECRLARKLSSP